MDNTWETLDSIVAQLAENERQRADLLDRRNTEIRRLRAAGVRSGLIRGRSGLKPAQYANIVAGRRR